MSYSVSILICTRNRAAQLAETLRALAAIDYDAPETTEILIVDNGSTDETASVINAYCNGSVETSHLMEARAGQTYARNRAITEARGDILLWTDDDVKPSKNWIQAMCAPIISGNADAVAGGILMAPHLRRSWMKGLHKIMLASTENFPEEAPINLIGANMAFHRRVLEKVPSFDTELGPGQLGFQDDALFSRQLENAGYRISRSLDICVEHHFAPDRLLRKNFLDRMIREGKSEAYVAHHWEHRDLEDSWKYDVKEILLPLYRLLRPAKDDAEGGISAREMGWLKDLAFRSQMQIERTRPRNYEKFGLVKLNQSSADIPVAEKR
ncbi:hypothetical protein CCAX7_009410 [Capsulimonas corticalis]|uniref:Uncharacterized protein n=1 Tax=Capsulimonas corticalis TaxID=2219043 RepID=A0A402CU89_9BACT|nr:glycosyltransferase family 2 protein [Capsulimonas corticalis]BDI28890.1 hypothetical protein CCAX7_009410 [Capsulimonas corticalis]